MDRGARPRRARARSVRASLKGALEGIAPRRPAAANVAASRKALVTFDVCRPPQRAVAGGGSAGLLGVLASELQQFAMGGGQRGLELGDFFAVAAFLVGQLGGELSDDPA